VNNLDLIVANAQTNQVWLGNSPHNEQILDDMNNVEQVFIDYSYPGFRQYGGANMSVSVRATNKPYSGEQAFSLVVTGTFDLMDMQACGGGNTVTCPNMCGGTDHGECGYDGVCSCQSDWTGADCGQSSLAMSPDTSENAKWTLNDGSVNSGNWAYYHFDVSASQIDQGLMITMQRTSSWGDPDLFVSFQSFPNLHTFDYSSTECEPCGSTSKPTLSQVIIPRDSLQVGRYRVGVHGYCCLQSAFTLTVATHDEPPGQPKWFRYVWIAAAITLFLTGAAAYFFVRGRATQASRQDGYVAARDTPGSRIPASSSGHVLGSSSGSIAASALAVNARSLTSTSTSITDSSSSSSSSSSSADAGAGVGMVHAAGSGGWVRLPQKDESPGS